MQKILLLAPRYLGVGGAERYTRQFARALAGSLGDGSVDVWSYLSGDATDGSGPRYLGAAASRAGFRAKAGFVARSLRVGRGYQLIVAGHVAVAPLARWLSRLQRMPYIVLTFGIEVWGPLPAGQRAALRDAELVVTVGRFTAGRIRQEHGVAADRVAIIPPVVDAGFMAQAEAGRARSGGGAKRVLTVARLAAIEGYKGCDTVLQVLPRIRNAAGSVEYVIVGDGDDRPRLERLAHDLGVEDIVHFAGAVGDAQLARVYAGSDLFVMPSRSGFSEGRWRGEGFGIVFIEAAAFGIPAIAGRGDGGEEAVEDGVTGLVVDGTDVEAVAAGLRTLLTDDALRFQMGQAARSRVLREFTVPRMERQVRELLAHLGTRARR